MKRLIYPDICKFIAIFLVTWSHCAQCIAGKTWTNLFGGTELDIAFNMPLFMMISGWFINPQKLRALKPQDYFLSKFKRLVIPSLVWYTLHLIIINKQLIFSSSAIYWYFYAWTNYFWYLNALFFCLLIIYFFSKVLRSDFYCCIISTTLVLACPISHIANINFMYPYIWAGYGVSRLFSNRNIKSYISICFIIGLTLCLFWNHSFTVYERPLETLHINLNMITSYIYRFSIGFCISAVIIYIMKRYENTFLRNFASLGQYSLIIYTASIILLDIISTVLNNLQLHINQVIILDLLSLCLCIIIIYFIIIFAKICRKHRWLKLLLMGEQ
jgi:fucose 4-O-acetylase-like acetyltransferase